MNRLIAGGLAASFLMQGCVVYSRDVDVVHVPTPPGDETGVLDATDRLADPELAHAPSRVRVFDGGDPAGSAPAGTG